MEKTTPRVAVARNSLRPAPPARPAARPGRAACFSATGKPRLGMAATYAAHCKTSRMPAERCASLFDAENFVRDLEQYVSGGNRRAERLEPYLRQNAHPEQGAVELTLNAMESLLGIKVIGRFGEGRLQNLSLIRGFCSRSVEVVSKCMGDVARRMTMLGVDRLDDDFDLEIGRVDVPALGESGTRVAVHRPLTTAEQDGLIGYLSAKLKFVRSVNLEVNGRAINEPARWQSLRGRGVSSPKGTVKITVDGQGYSVEDNGLGMDAETLIKRYLAIGNSQGEHNHTYDDSIQPADIYFAEGGRATRRGKVSILLCGYELQGIEIEGVNLEREIGLEMGTGLRRNQASDGVVFGQVEVARVVDLAGMVFKMSGARKWSILNSLLLAFDRVEFEHIGFKETLMDALFREAQKSLRAEAGSVLVPNEKAFEALQTSGQKVYLDRRLFVFDPAAAGLAEHTHYESPRGNWRLWEAEFSSRWHVYVEVGNHIILNRCYARNILLINLLFNFWIEYGPKIAGKVRILLPWERKAKGAQSKPESRATVQKVNHVVAVLQASLGVDAAQVMVATANRRMAELVGKGERPISQEEIFWGPRETLAKGGDKYLCFSGEEPLLWSLEGDQDTFWRIKADGQRELGGALKKREERRHLFDPDIEGGVQRVLSWEYEDEKSDSTLTSVWLVSQADGSRRKISEGWESCPKTIIARDGRIFLYGATSNGVEVRVWTADRGEEIISSRVFVRDEKVVELDNGEVITWGETWSDEHGTGAAVHIWRPNGGDETIRSVTGSNEIFSVMPGPNGEVYLVEHAHRFRKADWARGWFNDAYVPYYLVRRWQRGVGITTILDNLNENGICPVVAVGPDGKVFVVETAGKHKRVSVWEEGRGRVAIGEERLDWCGITVGQGGELYITEFEQFSHVPARLSVWQESCGERQVISGEATALPQLEISAGGRAYLTIKNEGDHSQRIFLVEVSPERVMALPFAAYGHDGLTIYGTQLPAAGPEVELPKVLPLQKSYFASHEREELYRRRRQAMCARLVRGDFMAGVSAEVFGYLGARPLQVLGEGPRAAIEQRLEGKENDFDYQERYLGFIERVWEESKGTIEPALFRRVVERWDILFGLYGGNPAEIDRIIAFFEKNNLFTYLYDGRGVDRGEEIETWIRFFREPDLEGLVARREYSVPELRGEEGRRVERHPFAFYAWAAQEHAGWEGEGVKRHCALIEEFSQLDRTGLEKRLQGDIAGQHLERQVYVRELAQNALDAGSPRLEIETSVQERDGTTYHVAEYRDYGRGLTAEDLKAHLFTYATGKMGEGDTGFIGGNGIGFKSTFKDASRVMVRASVGDGKVAEASCFCTRKDDKFEVADVEYFREVVCDDPPPGGLWVRVEEELGPSEDATTLVKAVFTELTFRSRVCRYVGLVRDMEITHNAKGTNEPILTVDSVTLAGRGDYALLGMGRAEMRVAQAGLWVNEEKDLRARFMPEVLREYVEDCAFEIGRQEKLVRGRGRAMVSDEDQGKALLVLAMQRAVKAHLNGTRRFMALPQDYLFGQDVEQGTQLLEVDISATTLADAEKINSGRALEVDFSPYQDGGQPLVHLISLIEVEGSDGIKVSFQAWRNALREAARSGARDKILDSELAGEEFRVESEQAVARRVQYTAEAASRNRRERLVDPQHLPYLDFVSRALCAMGASDLVVGMYSNPGDSALAIFDWGPDHGIFYRQEAARWQNAEEHLAAMHAGQPNAESYAWAYNVMQDEIVHESIHARFRLGEGWSHGADPRWLDNFARRYQDTVLTLIRAGFDEWGV